ncbi:MAG: homoserine dehydrogenase [Brevinematales bacterium]|jgi:homoserine dehydrogenase
MPGIGIALVGFGTIGSGVVRILEDDFELIREKTGLELRLKYVVDKDWQTPRNVEIKRAQKITDYKTVLEDKDINVVIELAGGTGFAYTLIEDCLKAGKNVVTANKALLAERGLPLFQLARDRNLSIGFEASVCGGIPIIRTVGDALVGDRINSIYGIVNGTTNYILTRMFEENLSFAAALKQAQKLGFAETDPTLDINGFDAAHKITILAELAYNININFSDVYIEGITDIQLEDIKVSSELGYVLKLIASAKLDPDKTVEVRVNPTLVPRDNQLSFVRNEFNAVMIESEYLGNSMYYGRGAGSMPTASAVIADIVDIAKAVNEPVSTLKYRSFSGYPLKNIGDIETRYYVRFNVLDKPGVLSKISGIFGANNISIASVIQKERSKTDYVPIIMTTHSAFEKDINNAFDEIEKLYFSKHRGVKIRIMDSLNF